ncbi:MAG: AraC family transcriptional regulator [Marinospirillum sp.]|uniref:helix-turn-helix domain-containing protein n=1 Tax=Marinospirillum sp. TaxID=2183934 RepID=UPI001A0A80E9|nr:helix-turn-helix domain-containing protein [Marinospirillum sp.]MBE0508125.1 AraC family transcriptional regulator [Marinospirillum sp.]
MSDPYLCQWTLQSATDELLIWPDGCRDVILVFAPDQPAQLLLTGLDQLPRSVCYPAGTLFVGARLAVGSFLSLERCLPFVGDDRWLPSSELPAVLTWEDSLPALAEVGRGWLSQFLHANLQPPQDWVVDYLQFLKLALPFVPHRQVSDRSFRRQLVRATGAPPRYWQNLARVRRTAGVVAASDEPLAAVAADLGFVDQAHLSRCLVQWLGQTPGRLRKNRASVLARLAAPDAFFNPAAGG